MAILITNSKWFGGKNLAGFPYVPNLGRGPSLDREASSEVQATAGQRGQKQPGLTEELVFKWLAGPSEEGVQGGERREEPVVQVAGAE